MIFSSRWAPILSRRLGRFPPDGPLVTFAATEHIAIRNSAVERRRARRRRSDSTGRAVDVRGGRRRAFQEWNGQRARGGSTLILPEAIGVRPAEGARSGGRPAYAWKSGRRLPARRVQEAAVAAQLASFGKHLPSYTDSRPLAPVLRPSARPPTLTFPSHGTRHSATVRRKQCSENDVQPAEDDPVGHVLASIDRLVPVLRSGVDADQDGRHEAAAPAGRVRSDVGQEAHPVQRHGLRAAGRPARLGGAAQRPRAQPRQAGEHGLRRAAPAHPARVLRHDEREPRGGQVAQSQQGRHAPVRRRVHPQPEGPAVRLGRVQRHRLVERVLVLREHVAAGAHAVQELHVRPPPDVAVQLQRRLLAHAVRLLRLRALVLHGLLAVGRRQRGRQRRVRRVRRARLRRVRRGAQRRGAARRHFLVAAEPIGALSQVNPRFLTSLLRCDGCLG